MSAVRRRRWPIIFSSLVAAGLTAWLCTPEGETGFVYASPGDKPLRLDIDYPPSPGPHPVVLFAPHRGDWSASFKRDDRFRRVLESLTRRGYAVATLHYRLVGEHRFPAQIEDGKAAVRWLRANARRLNLNSDRIGAVGASAGGYGVCMLGTTGPGDGFDPPGADATASRVQAVVALGAPCDLTTPISPAVDSQYLRPFLAKTLDQDPLLYRRASPGTYATPDDPPFLLIHSTGDNLVPIAQPRSFAARLRQVGVTVELVEEGGAQHVWGGERLDRSLERVGAFLDQHLRKATAPFRSDDGN